MILVYFLLACVLSHFILGWFVPLVLVLILSGFIFENHVGLKSSFIGFLLNGTSILYTFIMYSEMTNDILNDVSDIFMKMSPIFILLISLTIPLLLFGLAGSISSQIATIKKKLDN